jgi:hypothetical protein
MAGAPAWAFGYFRGPQIIERFCAFIMECYRDRKQIEAWKKPAPGERTTPDGTQWVSDMTLWWMFIKTSGVAHIDLTKPRDGIVFDGSIEDSGGFEMREGSKALSQQNRRVHGKWLKTGEAIQFAGLHLMGKFPKRLGPLFTGFPLPLVRACFRGRRFRNCWKLAQMADYCRQRRKNLFSTPPLV